MEIIEFILLITMLVIAFTIGLYVNRLYNSTSKEKERTITALEKEQKLRQKGFNNIMNYDINVAMGVKEQTEE